MSEAVLKDKLRDVLFFRNKTIKAFAKEVGLTHKSVYHYLNGGKSKASTVKLINSWVEANKPVEIRITSSSARIFLNSTAK